MMMAVMVVKLSVLLSSCTIVKLLMRPVLSTELEATTMASNALTLPCAETAIQENHALSPILIQYSQLILLEKFQVKML